jgi:two-component sensor histidine kinase
MNYSRFIGKMKIGRIRKIVFLKVLLFLFTIVFFSCKRPSTLGPLPPAAFYDQKIDSASRYIDRGSYHEAIELMTRITPGSESLQTRSYPQLLKIYILNGRLYKLVDQLDKAMSYLLKAKRLAVDFGIKKNMAEVNIQLAELHRVMREPAKANEILRETRYLLEDIPENYSLLALMFNRQASVTVTPDSMKYFSLKSLDYARKANDKNLVATSLNELGYLHRVKGFDTAMSYYRQSVELWRETGNRHEELNTLINIAYACYGNQQHTLSLMTLDTVRQILGAGYLRYIEHMRTFLISMNYQKLGKYDSAFFYLNMHYKNFFRDAKGDQYKKAKQFEFAEEMANRKYQAEQQERELALTKSMNVYIILSVLLLFFFGLFLFIINRKLRKKNREISRQNNEITHLYETLQQYLVGREALYRELHHRVVSNLALIRAIFLHHSMITTKPIIREVLKRSIIRLSSIEKIHQLVFTGSEQEQINGRQYIQSLGHHLLNLQQNTNRAGLELVCPDELKLSPKFTQFFGMIYSELLMNSMKHARVGPDALRCTIELKTDKNHLHVKYLDNGKPPEVCPAEPVTAENLGFYLIRTLTKQLSGECRIETNSGFSATFTFKKGIFVK